MLGSLLNYFVSPTGNPVLIFGGIALVCVAIGLDALAYRDLEGTETCSKKGILLSIGGGIGAGLFYPVVAKSLEWPGSPSSLSISSLGWEHLRRLSR